MQKELELQASPIQKSEGYYKVTKKGLRNIKNLAEKKGFQMPPFPSSYHIGTIYTIRFKNGLIRPFKTIFGQLGRASAVGNIMFPPHVRDKLNLEVLDIWVFSE